MRVMLACVLAAGCGDNTRNVVHVDLPLGTPELIRYRDDSGTWRSPEQISEGSYTFDVIDDFELVAVFALDDQGAFYAAELAGSYSESSHWLIATTGDYGALVPGKTAPASIFRDPCNWFPRDGTVVVSGQMAQAGAVAMDGSCKSSTAAPWMFSLAVRPGTRDLIATGQIGGVPTVAVSRNQGITGTTSLPVIDLASGGMRLDTTPILVRNADTSSGVPTASATVTLTTRNGASDVSSRLDVLSSAQAIVANTIPIAALEPGDSQALVIHSPGGEGAPIDRTGRTLFTGIETSFELLPPPAIRFSVADGLEVASWEGPLDDRYGYIDFDVESTSTVPVPARVQHVTATRRWLAGHDATSITFDTHVPGYLPSWAIDLTQGYARGVGVRDDSTSVTYMTTQWSNVQATP